MVSFKELNKIVSLSKYNRSLIMYKAEKWMIKGDEIARGLWIIASVVCASDFVCTGLFYLFTI